MNKIEFLDTTSLERLHKEFANPKTITESIMLRGIVAELETRWGGLKPQPTPREEELQEELDDANSEVEDLNKKLDDAQTAETEKDEEISRLKTENSDLDRRVQDALLPITNPNDKAKAA